MGLTSQAGVAGRIIIAALLATAWCGLAGAQAYKWTDANGRVQYSDKPPGGVDVKEIKRPTGSSSPGAAVPGTNASSPSGPQSMAEKEQAFRKRQIDQQEAERKLAKSDAEAKNRQEQCQRARQYLAGLEAGGRQKRYDAKGEPYFLDDDAIDREKSKARSDIGTACK